MKVVAATIVALSLLPATQLSARAASGRSGHTGGSRLSAKVAHSGGLHAQSGRHSLPQRFGTPHFHTRGFIHREHFRHERLFGLHHRLGRQGVIFHRPFGFHDRFFFGHRIIRVGPSSVVIWSQPPIISGPEPRLRAPMIEGEPHHERPLITLMLRHRKELELSLEQVQGLEQLRHDYQREVIRYEADLRIAEMELQKLLKADTVDLDKIKAKLQEIERLRVDLSFVRIRTIEQGKALLSPEQREKLQTLVGEFEQPRLITEASPE